MWSCLGEVSRGKWGIWRGGDTHLLIKAEMLNCKRGGKNHFVSVGCQHWLIIEWNDLRIQFPSLEKSWKTTECGGTLQATVA